jgi:hypothetical protein
VIYATHGTSEGFIEIGDHFTTLRVPGSSATLAFGLNNRSEVVGA